MAGGQTSQLQRRVRGLLNRMSDSNLPGVVADVLQLAEQEGERAIAEAVTAELLQVRVCLQPQCRLCLAASCSPCCVDLLVACRDVFEVFDLSFCMFALHVYMAVHVLDRLTVVPKDVVFDWLYFLLNFHTL